MKKILIVIALIIIAIQFIPAKTDNPSVLADFDGPIEVKEIITVSCYDCHSNETNWVWYTSIAPVSWLAAHNVNEGRDELNFSDWQNMPLEKQKCMVREIWEEIDEDEMPLKIHTIMHKDAILSNEQKLIIKEWALSTN